MKNTFIITLILLFSTEANFAQNLFQIVDSISQEKINENPEIGMSIGVYHNDLEFYKSYGKINAQSDIDINKNTIFEIASITKIITSNLIAQAALDNKFKLSDFIDDYLPSEYKLHPNLKNKVRISDLASHQSGLPDIDFGKLIELNDQQPISGVTSETLCSLINNCQELLDYGQYRYSTLGYTLLGQILESVYGMSYEDLLLDRIVYPLQLSNTLTKDFDVQNIAQGFNPLGGEQELFLWNIMAPAGLVKSNASDMITYVREVLDENSVIGQAALITEEIRYQEGQRAIGLGTNVIIYGDRVLYLKTGDSMGQSSLLCYDRSENWGMIILLNHRNSELRQGILDEVYQGFSERQ